MRLQEFKDVSVRVTAHDESANPEPAYCNFKQTVYGKHIVHGIYVIGLVIFLTMCRFPETSNERTQFSGNNFNNENTSSKLPSESPDLKRKFKPAYYSEPGSPVADGTLFFGCFHEYLYFLEKGPSPENNKELYTQERKTDKVREYDGLSSNYWWQVVSAGKED